MQIVIDVPEEIVARIKRTGMTSYPIAISDIVAFIPKGHGRLIDADAVITDLKYQCEQVFKLDAVKPEDYYITKDAKYMEAVRKNWCENFYQYLESRGTVLEADKEEDEQ